MTLCMYTSCHAVNTLRRMCLANVSCVIKAWLVSNPLTYAVLVYANDTATSEGTPWLCFPKQPFQSQTASLDSMTSQGDRCQGLVELMCAVISVAAFMLSSFALTTSLTCAVSRCSCLVVALDKCLPNQIYQACMALAMSPSW